MGLLELAYKFVIGYENVRNKFNNAMSIGIDTLGRLVQEFSSEIKKAIQKKLKKTVIKNFITILIYIGAMILSYFAFPNKTVAAYATSIILLLLLAFTVIRTVIFLSKNFYYIFCIIRCRFKAFDSIVYYVRHKKGKIANIAVSIVNVLCKIDFIKKETVKKLKRQVIKSAFGIVRIMIVDLVFFVVYMVVTSMIIEPILLNNVSELSKLQLYIYPFAKSIDLIFHTSICPFFGINV